MVYYGDSPETLTSNSEVFVGTLKANRLLTIRAMSAHKKHFIVSFDSVDSYDEAKALAGAGVYIYKSSLPPLPEDQYYWVDLIGCRVIIRSPCRLTGRVRNHRIMAEMCPCHSTSMVFFNSGLTLTMSV